MAIKQGQSVYSHIHIPNILKTRTALFHTRHCDTYTEVNLPTVNIPPYSFFTLKRATCFGSRGAPAGINSKRTECLLQLSDHYNGMNVLTFMYK